MTNSADKRSIATDGPEIVETPEMIAEIKEGLSNFTTVYAAARKVVERLGEQLDRD